MYEEIVIDGEVIKIRTDVSEEETGVVIENTDFDDTIDFTEKLGEINNG